jgi:hypothetical protein
MRFASSIPWASQIEELTPLIRAEYDSLLEANAKSDYALQQDEHKVRDHMTCTTNWRSREIPFYSFTPGNGTGIVTYLLEESSLISLSEFTALLRLLCVGESVCWQLQVLPIHCCHAG